MGFGKTRGAFEELSLPLRGPSSGLYDESSEKWKRQDYEGGEFDLIHRGGPRENLPVSSEGKKGVFFGQPSLNSGSFSAF